MHLLGPTSISITNTVTGKKQIVFFAYLLRPLFAELYKILQVIKKLACKNFFKKYRIQGKSLDHQDNIIPSNVKLVESSDSHKTDWDSFSPGQDSFYLKKKNYR